MVLGSRAAADACGYRGMTEVLEARVFYCLPTAYYLLPTTYCLLIVER